MGGMKLTLREEYGLSVLEQVLRRTFGPKGRNRWQRKLHDEELHNLYFSSNIIRVITSRRMTGACSMAESGECIWNFAQITLREILFGIEMLVV
jgi:hypothetical protein